MVFPLLVIQMHESRCSMVRDERLHFGDSEYSDSIGTAIPMCAVIRYYNRGRFVSGDTRVIQSRVA